MHRRCLLALATAVGMVSAAGALAQGAVPAQPLGVAVKVVLAGPLGAKVAGIVVTTVQAGSAAEAAGLQAGDEVMRVQGIAVPGADAFALRPHLHFTPGEPKTLVLRRPSGEEYTVTLARGGPRAP